VKFSSRFSGAVGVLVLACGSTPAPRAPAGDTAPQSWGVSKNQSVAAEEGKPLVVVALVVDQLAAWIAAERLPLLPANGGFARLRREGTWYQDVRFDHAITETGPGHASLFTGEVPRVNGVPANMVMGPHDTPQFIVRDPQSRLVDEAGSRDEAGASADVLRVPTLADQFRRRWRNATVVAISAKDRGALFAAGTSANAAVWFDSAAMRFVTSTNYSSALPKFVNEAAPPDVVRERARQPWELLDRRWVESHALSGDDQAGETDLEGYGTTFPHRADLAARPGEAFRADPASDELLLELALAALDAAPARSPKFIAVSLSASDAIGHLFGPDSWEAWDNLRRIDAALSKFFAGLDRRFGSSGWFAALAADHGVVPLPEIGIVKDRPACGAARGIGPCSPSRRLPSAPILTEARAAADLVLGPGNWVSGFLPPYLWLTHEALSLPKQKLSSLLEAMRRRLERLEGIREVFDVSTLPAACPDARDDSIFALVCRSVVPGVSGQLYVVTTQGTFFGSDSQPPSGTNHGSPYLYDRSIPVLLRAPGRVTAGAVVSRTRDFSIFFRTVSSWFH